MGSVRYNKSAQRALKVFELFSERMEALTVGEVATGLDIPQPSASVLLRNLVDMGYLHYDPDCRKFIPTLRIVLLSSWIDRRYSISAAMAGHLKELQDKLEETILIGTQNGAHAQYVFVNEPERPDRMIVSSGWLRPLLRSAVGRVLLSLKSDAEITGWVRRCNAEETDKERIVSVTSFLERMERARTLGYADTAGDVTPGYGTVAAAFGSPIDGHPMAIACGAPLARLEEKRERIVDALQSVASIYPLQRRSG